MLEFISSNLEMGENDENKPNEQGQLPSYEQSIQIPEDDKPELPPAYRFVEHFESALSSKFNSG